MDTPNPLVEAEATERALEALRTGGAARRFEGPEDQYLRDARAWDREGLTRVWKDKKHEAELAALFADPFRILRREVAQNALRVAAGLPDFTTHEYKSMANEAHIMRVKQEIDYVSALLDRIKAGEKKKVSRRHTQGKDNVTWKEIEVEYTSSEIRHYEQILQESIKLHEHLTDQAAELGKQFGGKASNITVNVGMMISDPATANMVSDLALAMAHKMTAARGATYEQPLPFSHATHSKLATPSASKSE